MPRDAVFLLFVIPGLAAAAGASLLVIRNAFKISNGWGMACFFFWPSMIFLALSHWEETRQSFKLLGLSYVAAFVLIVIGEWAQRFGV